MQVFIGKLGRCASLNMSVAVLPSIPVDLADGKFAFYDGRSITVGFSLAISHTVGLILTTLLKV